MREKINKIADFVFIYSLYALIFYIPISTTMIEIFAGFVFFALLVKKVLLVYQPVPVSIEGNVKRNILFDFSLKTFVKDKTHLFLLLFIIFCSFSVFRSGGYWKESLEALFFKWGEYIVIFLIFESAFKDKKRLRNGMFIILFVGGLVGIDVIFQYFLGGEFLRGREMLKMNGGTFAVTGPFKHYNDFAAYLVCSISLIITMLFRGFTGIKSKIYTILYRVVVFLVIILLSIALLNTFSRGGWLGFFSAMVLMLFLSPKNKIILFILFGFIIALIFIPGIKERALYTFQVNGDSDRFIMWSSAWESIKENPFLGKGVGTFMQHFSNYANGLNIQYAHNCYLQMWAETGIFALLSFLLFTGSILYKGIKKFFISVNRGEPSWLLLGLVCAIFGFMVHSFFDTQLYSLKLSVLFWTLLGITAGFD